MIPYNFGMLNFCALVALVMSWKLKEILQCSNRLSDLLYNHHPKIGQEAR